MKKSEILTALQALPEGDVTIDDVVEILLSAKRAKRPYSPALVEAIRQGFKDMEEGKTRPDEELYKEDMKWLDSL